MKNDFISSTDDRQYFFLTLIIGFISAILFSVIFGLLFNKSDTINGVFLMGGGMLIGVVMKKIGKDTSTPSVIAAGIFAFIYCVLSLCFLTGFSIGFSITDCFTEIIFLLKLTFEVFKQLSFDTVLLLVFSVLAILVAAGTVSDNK